MCVSVTGLRRLVCKGGIICSVEGAHKEAYMPATSITSVTMPASLFAMRTLSPGAWPLVCTLALSTIPFAATGSLLRARRSCLLAYSEDGSRRRGVACFVRAMGSHFGVRSPYCGKMRENLDDSARENVILAQADSKQRMVTRTKPRSHKGKKDQEHQGEELKRGWW
jgi:hypothetical protein